MVERRAQASQRTAHAPPPARRTLTMPDPLSQTSAATDPSSSIAIAAPVGAGEGVSGQTSGQVAALGLCWGNAQHWDALGHVERDWWGSQAVLVLEEYACC